MIHRIQSVGKLYNDTLTAKNKIIDGTANNILNNILKAKENFSENWHGKDAGEHIQQLVGTYNGMIEVRNSLALICAGLTRVTKGYKEVQTIIKPPKGKETETYIRLRYEALGGAEDYSDNRDIIDINSSVLEGLKNVDIARSALNIFIQEVSEFRTSVLNNWIEGAGRDQMIHKFDTFTNDLNKYDEALNLITSNVHKALENYSNIH